MTGDQKLELAQQMIEKYHRDHASGRYTLNEMFNKEQALRKTVKKLLGFSEENIDLMLETGFWRVNEDAIRKFMAAYFND